MFTELVTAALKIAKPDQDYRVVFINDWGAHLTDLLPTGAFDMGFPWFLPDCTKLENLSPANALRCTDYDATEPFFEAVVGFYTMKGSKFEGTTSHEQLAGARLCRPDGWFTFDLEAAGLVEPTISMTVAPTQVACWEALQEKEVDVVTFDALPAEADIQALGLSDIVIELPAVSTVARMHVLTPKTNPNGKAYIALLNAGLEKMRSNGQWFAIVSKHLSMAQANK
jgi:polar amino acid transport system substrate-binding protein